MYTHVNYVLLFDGGGGRACLERFSECLLKKWLSFQFGPNFLVPVIKCQVKVLLVQKTDNDIQQSNCGFAVWQYLLQVQLQSNRCVARGDARGARAPPTSLSQVYKSQRNVSDYSAEHPFSSRSCCS